MSGESGCISCGTITRGHLCDYCETVKRREGAEKRLVEMEQRIANLEDALGRVVQAINLNSIF